jgi:hypothetical protein
MSICDHDRMPGGDNLTVGRIHMSFNSGPQSGASAAVRYRPCDRGAVETT